MMIYRPIHRFSLSLTALTVLLAGCSSTDQTATTKPVVVASEPIPEPTPEPIANPINNLIEVFDGLWSGSEPTGEAEYAQLQSMGIRTVICVDAVAPNVELAAAHNIRVVHLPIGYDKISDKRIFQFTFALATLDHPIYIHCHHGKHRGPAAAAALAIASGQMTTIEGVEFMERAGTSRKYSGLWKSVQQVPRLNVGIVGSMSFPLPERQELPGIVTTMGRIDRLHDQLWDSADMGFAPSEDHPDLTPNAIAGQIQDLLRSCAGSEEISSEGTRMKLLLDDAITASSLIEQALGVNDLDAAQSALNALSDSCTNCHTQLRD